MNYIAVLAGLLFITLVDIAKAKGNDSFKWSIYISNNIFPIIVSVAFGMMCCWVFMSEGGAELFSQAVNWLFESLNIDRKIAIENTNNPFWGIILGLASPITSKRVGQIFDPKTKTWFGRNETK